MNSTVKLLTAFVLGSAFGVVTGLLMAPTSGKQARKKLSKKSRKLAKKMAGMIRKEERLQRTRGKRTAKTNVSTSSV